MYKPKNLIFNTEISIQNRIDKNVNGAADISYEAADPEFDYCHWKGKVKFDGVQSGVASAADTAELTMNYRPDIAVMQNRIILNGNAYNVIGVENVEQENKYMILTVQKVSNA